MSDNLSDTRQSLSDLARRYLASLPRDVAIPTSRVEQGLIDEGIPVFDTWLEFHENYAGYRERIGGDGCRWGLLHEKLIYCPNAIDEVIVDAQLDPSDGLWYIYCADVHPSYNYMLDQNGHFQEGPCSSFNMYIEQQATLNHFCTSGGKPQLQFSMSQESIQHRVDEQASLMSTASDQYNEYWLSDTLLAVRDAESLRWLKVITR